MQDLKVIGVEDGSLVAASDDGARYRLVIDEVLQSKLRQLRVPAGPTGARISPREIQQHIRAGLSAEDVATLTGASLEYVQRFEGPIVAERSHVVAQALSVPVRTGAEVDPLGEIDTFGSVIRERLASLGALGERWASWKDAETGWMIKLEFASDGVDHDARWSFEPRKGTLVPVNVEANTLSQQGEVQQGGLIPRLRAVAPLIADESRFDSGAFDYVEPAEPLPAPVRQNTTVAAAINRADDDEPKDVHQTADLLEALRRRRGEREAAQLFDIDELETLDELDDEVDASAELSGYDDDLDGFGDLGLGDVSDDDISDDDELVSPPQVTPTPAPAASLAAVPAPAAVTRIPSSSAGANTANQTAPLGARGGTRRGRASMPSWDEIVFGARTDDDTA